MSVIPVAIGNKKLKDVSPILYGIFFEDINYGGDGGLYGELLPNRAFEYYDRDGKTDKSGMCWEPLGNTRFTVKTDADIHYAEIEGEGIRNIGWCGEGFGVRAGGRFRFSCYAFADSEVTLEARIVSGDGTLAVGEFTAAAGERKKYALTLTASGECGAARLEIHIKRGGTVRLNHISLFPEDTFRGRENGMRRDIAEMIAALKPKFMRFPGGCLVEGRSFENMYRWKDTVGPVETRRANWNRWQMDEYYQAGGDASDYFQSGGLGFYEYFLFCEDIGAKPLPVVNCGMTCQWHEGLLADMDRLGEWIDDALDLVEFANGDQTTKWGAVRAAMGHPEPFGLEYIGIGNEQWGGEYFKRYEAFYRAFKERRPEIKLVVSAGWNSEGEDFDTAVRWMESNKEKAYAVDEHFYKSPDWFLENISRYDGYDRTMPKVFIGEYAAHSAKDIPARRSNWRCALAEAAFLTGVENNADHVVMAAYAPLLAREGHQQWQPDMIWFDNLNVYGTPSYYVQKLFSENSVSALVGAECADADIKLTAGTDNCGRLTVKLVNVSAEPKALILGNVPEHMRMTMIVAAPEDENSMSEPFKVFPSQTEIDTADAFTLPPYSVAVIKSEDNVR